MASKPPRVLVTGSAGKVGRHVVLALRAKGVFVVGVDLVRGVFDTPLPGITAVPDVYIQADLQQPGDAYSCIARFRPDAVIHVAAIPDPTHTTPATVFVNNISSTFNIIEACVRLGVRRLVNISSETVPGFFGPTFCPEGIEEPPIVAEPAYCPVDELHPCSPLDPYAQSKHFGEQLCDAAVRRAAATLSVVSIRPSWCQDEGNIERNLGPFLTDPALLQPGMWSYIAIPDLADAIVRASEATSVAPGRHEVVYIAAADNIGGRDLAKAVAAAYGGRVPMKATPLPRADASGLDCSKATALLGWTPQLSWRDYLDERGALLPGVRALQSLPGGVHPSVQIKAAPVPAAA